MKRQIAMVLTMVMCLSMVTMPAIAEDNIQVMLGGVTIEFDQPPIIEDGRTLVPMRKIFEAMGATVEWDGATQTVTGTKGDTVIIMRIDDTILTKNGVQTRLDVSPKIVNSRTLVPVRAVAESFNCAVDWDGGAQRVSISADRPLSASEAAIVFEVGYDFGYTQGESDRKSNASFVMPLAGQGFRAAEQEAYNVAYKQGWDDGYAGLKKKTEETPTPAPEPASTLTPSSTRHTPTPEEIADPSYIYTHYGPEYKYEWCYVTGYHIGYDHGEAAGRSNWDYWSYNGFYHNTYIDADERAGYEAGFKQGYADGYKAGYESDFAQMKRLEK
jgi:hypothetical protein